MNPGIDYGLGSTNIDHESGIRYGVISQHVVGERWYEDSEPEYGNPTCPDCGTDINGIPTPADEEDPSDYYCDVCDAPVDSDCAFGDEPLGYSYVGEGYTLADCLDSDIMVLKSPYYTYAQFCSPCVPGAGNLEHPLDGDCKHLTCKRDRREHGLQVCADVLPNKCYCLGHDWFEEGKAPYPVYSLETGELVEPEVAE